ncbi:response regulator, partial [candidate division WOR-3 bacterium]|nr:response regulator [candidate division WOR-3 bacterium]
MPASAPGDCAAGSGPRPAPVVLVVDDDQAFCASLVDILEAKGYRAAAAGSCRQAYAEIERTTPDAAVVDVRLPDGTGLDVLAHAREKSPDTGVIILTGHATLDTAVRALNLGAAGYLEKPYAIDRLFLLLERTIDRRGPGRQSPGQALLASSPMPTVAFDVETAELVATNAAADRLFETIRSGTPASLRSLFSDGGIDAFVDHLADLKARGRAQTDVLIDVPSGGSRWYEVNSVRRDDSPGTALAVVFDVTERRQAEGDSRRARQYFEAIVDNMPGALVIIDSRYVIQRANPAFAAFFRASPAA